MDRPAIGAEYLQHHALDVIDAVPDFMSALAGGDQSKMHPTARQMLAFGTRMQDVAATIGRHTQLGRNEPDRGPARAVDAAITSDALGDILRDSVERIIAQRYAAGTEHRALVSRIPVADFQPVSLPEIDVEDSLDRVREGESAPMRPVTTRAGETGQVKSFGRIIAISHRTLLSEDDAGIPIMARRLGDVAVRNEASQIYSIIDDNPTLNDGSSLWSGQSYVNSGQSSLNTSALRQGMQALREQTTVGGQRGNFTPATLLCSSDEEVDALNEVRNISTGEPRMRVIASPWLSSGAFYLFADPRAAPVIGMLSLGGADENQETYSVDRRIDDHRRQLIRVWQDVGFMPISRVGAVKVTS